MFYVVLLVAITIPCVALLRVKVTVIVLVPFYAATITVTIRISELAISVVCSTQYLFC